MSKKQQPRMDRETEKMAAQYMGKHVSEKKAKLLLAVSSLAAISPMLLGVGLWSEIPEIYETGLIGASGQDDSLPRWAVVFLIPALMCLLNFLCHHQLRSCQKRMVVPKTHFRLVGRWGFPILSVLFAGGLMREAAGLTPLPISFLTPCILGLLLVVMGGHMYEVKEDSLMSLNFSFLQNNPILWREVHHFAGLLWLWAGLGVILLAMLSDMTSMIASFLALVAILTPWLYGRQKAVSSL